MRGRHRTEHLESAAGMAVADALAPAAVDLCPDQADFGSIGFAAALLDDASRTSTGNLS